MARPSSRTVEVTRELLREHPLPETASDCDKEGRGRVLIVAGSLEVPGAALLAGEAAMRAGAGKVALAVPPPLAASMGIAFPECKAVALDADAGDGLLAHLDGVAVVLVGPGMDKEIARAATTTVLRHDSPALVVLDAAALGGLWQDADLIKRRQGRAIVTPNAGEMAKLCGRTKEDVLADPVAIACEAAAHLGAVVVLKGATTVVASPEGQTYRHCHDVPGLAVAGSGDVLAGLIAGLAARGASAIEASLWGVFLHAQAGLRLARVIGTMGYLARELAREFPALIESFTRTSSS